MKNGLKNICANVKDGCKKFWDAFKVQILFFIGLYVLALAGICWYQYSSGERLGLGETFYRALRLFVMENDLMDKTPINPLWQFARFLCPLATVAFVLPAIQGLFSDIKIRSKMKRADSIAVHGDNNNIDLVVKNLEECAVHSDRPAVFQAKRHILMFDDDLDMYRFLDEHGSKFFDDGEKELFLCSEKILRGDYSDRKITVCNIAENCARDYWDKHPIRHKREKVLIIGFDNYGQKLLSQAILKNVVDVDSDIQYYVVGDFDEYLAKQYKMHKAIHIEMMDKAFRERGYEQYRTYEPICANRDTVYFHKDMTWVEVMNLGISFDRIILIDDLEARNLDVFNDLKTYYVTPECHIKVTDKKIMDRLWNLNDNNIVVFGVNEELYNPEIILKEKLFHDAKLIHAKYYSNSTDDKGEPVCKCGNKNEHGVIDLEKCIGCDRFLEDWNRMNTFTRYSNVAAADHVKEKVRLVLGPDVDCEEPGIGKKALEAYNNLSEEEQKVLQKIEHIRWDRYHFMNNWDYAPVRQKEKRLHHLLIPFENLTVDDQNKDGDAYIAMGTILK